MASVTYRKIKDKWYLRFRKKGYKEKTLRFPGSLSERQIKKIRDQKAVKWEMGEDPFTEQVNISLLLAARLYCEAKALDWSDKTQTTNSERLRLVCRDVPLYSLSEPEVQGWLDGLSVGAESKKSYAATLNSFLKWLYDNEYVTSRMKVVLNGSDKKKLKKKRIKYITLDQLQAVFDALEDAAKNRHRNAPKSRNRLYMKDIWMFAFWQLLRRDEIIRIKPEDVSPDLRFITIHGKGGAVDTIPVVEPAKYILEKWLPGTKGEPLFGLTDSKNLWRAFNQCIKTACPGSGLSLHSLRHGGIVHYLSQGISINHVSKLARHKSVRITADIYGDVIPVSVEEAFSGVK